MTSDSPPQEDGELQIVHSTVQRVQRGPMRGVKRPRPSPQQQAAQQLSPMKALLVQAARAAAAMPPPPPEPEPEGPKCGICLEVRRLAVVFACRVHYSKQLLDGQIETHLLLYGGRHKCNAGSSHPKHQSLPPPRPLQPMGGSEGRQMASGNCGHVYCYDCLLEAVRAQKKCPTCRKGMQPRTIHKVFLNFT